MLGEEQDSCIELREQGWSFLYTNALLKIVEEGIDKIILVDYLTIDVKLFEIEILLKIRLWPCSDSLNFPIKIFQLI